MQFIGCCIYANWIKSMQEKPIQIYKFELSVFHACFHDFFNVFSTFRTLIFKTWKISQNKESVFKEIKKMKYKQNSVIYEFNNWLKTEYGR